MGSTKIIWWVLGLLIIFMLVLVFMRWSSVRLAPEEIVTTNIDGSEVINPGEVCDYGDECGVSGGRCYVPETGNPGICNYDSEDSEGKIKCFCKG